MIVHFLAGTILGNVLSAAAFWSCVVAVCARGQRDGQS
jgi:hypothetical protein